MITNNKIVFIKNHVYIRIKSIKDKNQYKLGNKKLKRTQKQKQKQFNLIKSTKTSRTNMSYREIYQTKADYYSQRKQSMNSQGLSLTGYPNEKLQGHSQQKFFYGNEKSQDQLNRQLGKMNLNFHQMRSLTQIGKQNLNSVDLKKAQEQIKKDITFSETQISELKAKLQRVKQWRFVQMNEFMMKKNQKGKIQESSWFNLNLPKLPNPFSFNTSTDSQKQSARILEESLRLSYQFQIFLESNITFLKQKYPLFQEECNDLDAKYQLKTLRQDYQKLYQNLYAQRQRSQKLQKLRKQLLFDLKSKQEIIGQCQRIIRQKDSRISVFEREIQHNQAEIKRLNIEKKNLRDNANTCLTEFQNKKYSQQQLQYKLLEQKSFLSRQFHSNIENHLNELNEEQLFRLQVTKSAEGYHMPQKQSNHLSYSTLKVYVLDRNCLESIIQQQLKRQEDEFQKIMDPNINTLRFIEVEKQKLLEQLNDTSNNLEKYKQLSKYYQHQYYLATDKLNNFEKYIQATVQQIKIQHRIELQGLKEQTLLLQEKNKFLENQLTKQTQVKILTNEEKLKQKQINQMRQVIRKEFQNDYRTIFQNNKKLQQQTSFFKRQLQEKLRKSEQSQRSIEASKKVLEKLLKIKEIQKNKIVDEHKATQIQLKQMYQNKVKDLESQIFEIKQQLIFVRQEKYQSQQSASQSYNNSILAILNQATQNHKREMDEQKNKQKESVNEYQMRIYQLNCKITQLEETIKKLNFSTNSQNLPQTDEFSSLKQREFELQQSFKRLQEQKKALESNNIGLQEEKKQIQQALNLQILNLQQQLRKQADQLKSKTQINDALNNKLAQKDQVIAQKNEIIKQKISLIQDMGNSYKTQSKEIDQLKAELARFQLTTQQYQRQQTDQNLTNLELKNLKEQLNGEVQMRKRLQRENKNLTEDLSVAGQQTSSQKFLIEQLREQLNQIKSKPKLVTTQTIQKDPRINFLEQQVLLKNGQIDKLKGNLKAQKESADTQISKLSDQLRSRQSTISQLKSQIQQLQQKIKKTQNSNRIKSNELQLQRQKQNQPLYPPVEIQKLKLIQQNKENRSQDQQKFFKLINFSGEILKKRTDHVKFLVQLIEKQTQHQIDSTELLYRKNMDSKDLTKKITQVFSNSEPSSLKAFLLLYRSKSNNDFGIFCCKIDEKHHLTLLVNLKTLEVFGPREGTTKNGYKDKSGGSIIEFGAEEIRIQKEEPSTLSLDFEVMGERYFEVERQNYFTNESGGKVKMQEVQLHSISFIEAQQNRFSL